ncbi:MAG: hypothetical protein ACRBCJ_14240 [Hyphomicrobiaceae bacterium]
MMTEAPTTPACVYLLADHLDAALAAGEDLIKAGLKWTAHQSAGQTSPLVDHTEQRETLEEIRTLELLIIARVLQARDRANEVAEYSTMFRTLAKLFVSGTTNLRDIIESCGDSTAVDFQTGDGTTSYLRSRGLIQPDAACIRDGGDAMATAEAIETNFLVAARLPLSILLDNVATFLDALDTSFELYEVDDEDEPTPIEATPFDDAAYDDAIAVTASDHISSTGEKPDIEIILKSLRDGTRRETLAERLARLPQG